MRNRTIGFSVAALAVAAFSTPARASPYWVAWEGNDFPENEGWTREGSGSRASRSLLDGVMTLDSLANDNGQDFYGFYGAPDPAPGEEFVVQWRLRVNEVIWDNPNFRYDPGWSVNSADGWQAHLVLGVDELHNLLEQIDVSFEPGVFHEWEFRSTNMRTFTLALDGTLVSTGAFVGGLPEAQVAWGDFVWGPTSNVEWDYFRFGVVPEPASCVSVLTLAFAYSSRRTR